MQLELIVGMKNEKGEQEDFVLSSELFLATLAKHLDVDGPVFNEMSATDPKVIPPSDYEIACEEMGLLQGCIIEVAKSNLNTRH